MKRRFGLLLGALVLAISAVTMAGCPKTAVSPQGQTGYAVSFGVEGEPANGTLTAKIGGKEFKNKESAPLGATVVFTARPNGGFKVKEWKVDGKTVDGTENTYSLKISKAVDVKVSFEKTSPSPAPTTKRKVNFGVEGGNGTLTATVGENTITSGAEVEQGKTVLFKAHPDKGYMVESWTGITPASPNATEVTHTVTADITVKVRFKPIPSQTFSVTVEAGEHGKVSVNPSLLEGNKAAKDTVLLFTATADDGFVVDKWTIQGGSFESGTGTAGNVTAKVKVTADVTVKVSFKAKPAGTVQYKVEHWQQNITGNEYTKIETDTATEYGKPDDLTQAAAKTYEGFTSKAVTQVKIKADGSTVVKIEYDRKEITLTLDLKEGSTTTQLTDGNKLKGRFGAVVSVAKPTKTGYAFNGWNPELPEKFPAENGTYTAQWAKEGDYTITYNLNGGKNHADNPASYNVETETITLKDAERTDYDFKGWYDNADFTGSPVMHIAKGSAGNKEFWAKWKARPYTITYNLNGGKNHADNPAYYTVEMETIQLKDATKTGYSFMGWYEKADFTGGKVTQIAKGCTGNKEFWAKWGYSVRFSVEGENGMLTAEADGIVSTSNSPITVEPGKEVTFTAKAEDGYVVDKWTISGSSFESGSGAAGSTTAKVKITAETEVKVTFKLTDKKYTVGGVDFTMKMIEAVTNGTVGHSDESTNQPHTVSLTAYRIGETEVTQELWQAVMGTNPSFFDNTGIKTWSPSTYDTSPANGEAQGKRPVEYINWYDCIAFCNELTKKVPELGESQCVYTVEGHIYTKEDAEAKKDPIMDMSKKGFRLPTEAEWEWAAKGGKDYRWAGVNDKNELKKYAWYANYDGGDANKKTHEVKKKQPNGYGLYDMSGNVEEWCWDWYADLPSVLPADYEGAASSSFRVVRGGSWFHNANRVARAYRGGSGPLNIFNFMGLRVACRP